MAVCDFEDIVGTCSSLVAFVTRNGSVLLLVVMMVPVVVVIVLLEVEIFPPPM
jgi:hypothetical protein